MSTTPEPTTPPGTVPHPPLAVRPAEAARMLGISPRLLWEKTNSGQIPAAKLGRAVLYRVADLDAWLAEQTARGVRR